MRRHTGRAVQEALLGDHFISDGSSLQEWLYGAARLRYGMNPNADAGNEGGPATVTPEEMAFFGKVVEQYGHAFKQHVKATYDAYVHLRHELPIAADGHRPMNNDFRATVDKMLLATLDELEIPCHVVSGSMAERIEAIARIFDWTPVMSTTEAIERARHDYEQAGLPNGARAGRRHARELPSRPKENTRWKSRRPSPSPTTPAGATPMYWRSPSESVPRPWAPE